MKSNFALTLLGIHISIKDWHFNIEGVQSESLAMDPRLKNLVQAASEAVNRIETYMNAKRETSKNLTHLEIDMLRAGCDSTPGKHMTAYEARIADALVARGLAVWADDESRGITVLVTTDLGRDALRWLAWAND